MRFSVVAAAVPFWGFCCELDMTNVHTLSLHPMETRCNQSLGQMVEGMREAESVLSGG